MTEPVVFVTAAELRRSRSWRAAAYRAAADGASDREVRDAIESVEDGERVF